MPANPVIDGIDLFLQAIGNIAVRHPGTAWVFREVIRLATTTQGPDLPQPRHFLDLEGSGIGMPPVGPHAKIGICLAVVAAF